MADRSVPYSALWHIYRTDEYDQYRPQILHWFNLEKHLPLYSPEMQLEVLEGAPVEILTSKAIFKLIHPVAKRKLGLATKEPKTKQKKEWWNKPSVFY